jgi:hypothetical protein
MACKHQFVQIEQINKPKGDKTAGGVWWDMFGARVGCPLCGEVRVIWSDGDIIIEYAGHEPKSGRK